jgi:hypothetical protein
MICLIEQHLGIRIGAMADLNRTLLLITDSGQVLLVDCGRNRR